jgi:hypothetical protein
MKKYKSKHLEGKQYYSWEYDEHTNFMITLRDHGGNL